MLPFSKRFKPAPDLLKELGITEPQEIDIEAIAEYCGATVLYGSLTGCDARIIGSDDRAIITVSKNSSRGRERFSAAHELAHWLRDAGEVSLACNPEREFDTSSGASKESRANEYAAELLLPTGMFRDRARNRSMTIRTVTNLAEIFSTSLTATALRLTQLGSFPAVVVVSDRDRVRWFRRGPDIPDSLWPTLPNQRTFAHDVTRDQSGGGAGDVYVEDWFSGATERHRIHEDSIRIGEGLALSLLSWKDEAPLEAIRERDDERAYRRSDGRRDE